MTFEVGACQVIPGFENAVLGMEKGDEKEFKLQPSDAYGDYKPELLKHVPRAHLPEGEEVKPGTRVLMKLENGTQIPATITEVTDELITIDLNSPLAGKVLNFTIKIVDVSS